jgi:hypothetical protein
VRPNPTATPIRASSDNDPTDRHDRLDRVPVSDALRGVLVALATGDIDRPVPWGQITADELVAALDRERLIGLAHRYVQESPHRDDVPALEAERVREAHLVTAIRLAVTYQMMGHVLRHLAKAAPPYLVAKGPAVAQLLYPNPWLRTFSDVDVIVHQSDWRAMDEVVIGMGFVPERDARVPLPPLTGADALYERTYRHPSGFTLDVHYDDLLNCGLAARDANGFWRRAQQIDIEGVRVRTLAPADQFVHLCAHAHYHGYTRLVWLSDLAFLLRDHGDTVDWDQVVRTVQLEEAQVPVYYTARLLEALLGVAVPPRVLAQVRPDRIRRAIHELLLPERDLVALRPMWRPDLSFYFLPLLKRLVPDMLVMGRRRDKLAYLARLLVPPPHWLRRYYSLSPSSPIWPHYVLHPLKLLYHYATELITAARLRRLRLDEDDLPYLRRTSVDNGALFPQSSR